MKLNGNKQLTAMVITLTIMFAGVLTVETGHTAQNHAMPGVGGGFVGLKTLIQLDLSDTQKVAIGNLLTKYRDQGENLRAQVREARERLRSATHAEKFNEENVRQAYQQMTPLMEERVVLKAKFMAELKSVLNSDQLAFLEDKRGERAEKMAERRRVRQALMDTWLQMKSE